MATSLYRELISDRAFGSREILDDYLRFCFKSNGHTEYEPENLYDDRLVLSSNLETKEIEVFEYGEHPYGKEYFNTDLMSTLYRLATNYDGHSLETTFGYDYKKMVKAAKQNKYFYGGF